MSILGINLLEYLQSSSFKNNKLKPLFGQPYLNTTGYDSKREELYCKSTKNVKINNIERNLKLEVGIVENASDSEGISSVLRISKLEFLKMLANKKSNLNQILKFLYENGDKLCLICSIYIVDEEATLDNKSTKNGIRSVLKLLLGHHVILCVPLKSRIKLNDEVKQDVMSLLSKNDNGHLPGYLMQEAAILIDFNEIIYKPAFEILNELDDRKFSDKVVSLLVELPEHSGNLSYYHVSSDIAVMLKLKKLLFLYEEKFLFTSNYKGGRKPISWDERNQVADDITSNFRKIRNMDFSHFPPPILQTLYNLFKVFEFEYYYEVNVSSEIPEVQHFLDTNLENAFNIVKALPFKKQQNGWIIEVNDENAKEIYSIYLSGIICILVTHKTKHLVTNFLNESIICLLSTEEKRKNYTEPMFIHHGKTEVFMGIIEPNHSNNEKFENGEIYLGFCSCNIKQEPKVWICAKFETLKVNADLNVEQDKNDEADKERTSVSEELTNDIGNLFGHRLPFPPVKEVSQNSNVDLTEKINNFADKFADEMRQGKLSRTLCEEFVEFQMAKNCKVEQLQLEQLLDALISTEITLLPENEFIADIQNLRNLLEEEQLKRMPKIKNIEVKVGENIVLFCQMQENENLHKSLSFRKESNETLLEITANSADIADYFLPESKTVILKIDISWKDSCIAEILPLYNVITISPKRVFTYIPFSDDSSNFPSSVDYKDPNPIIGVDYDSPTVIKDAITALGLTTIPRHLSNAMTSFTLRGFPELLYSVPRDQSAPHFVNPESVIAELLKEATKDIPNKEATILLTIPRHFNDAQTAAYSKAAEYANMKNIKFIDEITALAFGFEAKQKMDENKIYLLIHYFYPNFTVSLFKSGIQKDKEISTEQIEFEDFKEWENIFFDSIINENEENNCKNSNEITQLLEKMSLSELKPDSIILALKSSLLSKILTDYFPNTEITTINDPESYISEGANLASHTSLLP